MIIDWFPTPWHLIATVIATGGILLSFGIWIGKVNTDRSTFKKHMIENQKNIKELREDMKELRKEFINVQRHMPSPSVVSPNSPVRLTEFGEKISTTLFVGNWAANHAKHLEKRVSGKPEFEIFETCVEYVADQFNEDPDLWRKVREGAYNIGTEVEQVKKVYEVELRDALLSARQDS